MPQDNDTNKMANILDPEVQELMRQVRDLPEKVLMDELLRRNEGGIIALTKSASPTGGGDHVKFQFKGLHASLALAGMIHHRMAQATSSYWLPTEPVEG